MLKVVDVLKLSALAACTAMAMQSAGAAPVVMANALSYTVGDTVTFTVHDDRVEDGQDLGFYLADMSFIWDTSVLKILGQPLTLVGDLAALQSGGGFVSVGAAGYDGAPDATNSGLYAVSMLTDPPAASGDVTLFTLAFEALQASTGSTLAVSPVVGGSYGATGDFARSSSAPITVTGGGTVPEPGTWALSALALLAMAGTRRRRGH